MLKYLVISSGSCGNCYALSSGDSTILVDFGLSTKRVLEALSENGIEPNSVKAIFISHLHPDHASKSLAVFKKKFPNVLIFINRYAAKKEYRRLFSLDLDLNSIDFFDIGDVIEVGEFVIKSCEAYHDCLGCVSYLFSVGDKNICFITDTGTTNDKMLEFANESSLLFLESDYDDELLEKNDRYSPELKCRIRSDMGHLSNTQSLDFLLKLNESVEREVLLIHLSEDNNSPERALAVTAPALKGNKSIRAIKHGGFLSGEKS